jgi:hypothetical protein
MRIAMGAGPLLQGCRCGDSRTMGGALAFVA